MSTEPCNCEQALVLRAERLALEELVRELYGRADDLAERLATAERECVGLRASLKARQELIDGQHNHVVDLAHQLAESKALARELDGRVQLLERQVGDEAARADGMEEQVVGAGNRERDIRAMLAVSQDLNNGLPERIKAQDDETTDMEDALAEARADDLQNTHDALLLASLSAVRDGLDYAADGTGYGTYAGMESSLRKLGNALGIMGHGCWTAAGEWVPRSG